MLGPAVENQAAYSNAQIRFLAAFMNYLEKTGPDPIEAVAMDVSSVTATEEHIFLGDIPGFTEWTTDRPLGSMQAHNIIIKNRDWASGIRIHRNQIMDDRLGLVMPRIAGLAQRARQHRPFFITEMLLNGFAGNANFGSIADANLGSGQSYDGAFFFSAAHSLENGPNQSNYLNAALTYAALEQGISQMRRLKTWDGTIPLNVKPTHLLVGPKLEFTAKRMLQQKLTVLYPSPGTVAGSTGGQGFQTGAESNIHEGELELLVSPRLDDYTGVGGGDYSQYWMLLDLSQLVKPLLYQQREPIAAEAQVGWENEGMFMRGEMRFGAQARYNVGYYDWRLALGAHP